MDSKDAYDYIIATLEVLVWEGCISADTAGNLLVCARTMHEAINGKPCDASQ